jgi:hypothetical protein
MKRIKGKVADAKNNDGFHNLPGYYSAVTMLRDHDYTEARLYHICFTDSDTKKPYLAAMKALAEHLRKHNIRCQYRAALEISSAGKLHMHTYYLVEGALNNPDHILNRKADGWLAIMLLKRGMSFYLNHPRSPMHYAKNGSQKNYASVPKTKEDKVADCCTWIQYLYKHRDKPASGQVYFSSRPQREIKPRPV